MQLFVLPETMLVIDTVFPLQVRLETMGLLEIIFGIGKCPRLLGGSII